MRITYYALKPLSVGDEIRQAGDLVPEAAEFPSIAGYVQDGKLAPVLVATLPEDVQQVLLDWESDQAHPEEVVAEDVPVDEGQHDAATAVEAEAAPEAPKRVARKKAATTTPVKEAV